MKDKSGKVEKSTREAPQTAFGEKVENLLSNYPEISQKDRAAMVKGADLLNTQSPESTPKISSKKNYNLTPLYDNLNKTTKFLYSYSTIIITLTSYTTTIS